MRQMKERPSEARTEQNDREEMRKDLNRNPGGQGVRLRALNVVTVIAAVAFSALLLFTAQRSVDSYHVMRDATETYIACQRAAADMQEASDYLAEQARCFAVTGVDKYMWNYIHESVVRRRRENAQATVEEYLEDEQGKSYLNAALRYSMELMGQEYYSMRLAAEARGYNVYRLPEVLRDVQLTPEDAALSREEQRLEAIAIMFDNDYRTMKETIDGNVELFLDTLATDTRQEQLRTSDYLFMALRGQQGMTVILLATVVAIVLMSTFLVILPLYRFIGLIRDNQLIPPKGSYELRYLARTYNEMYERNRKRQDELSHNATHDPLTGLYNRAAYKTLRATYQDSAIGLLLVDLDKFKGVNDTYGHDVGDKILKKVAQTLSRCFRSDDAVCRIGGDEFAVIMVRANSGMENLVRMKVENANRALQDVSDGLPPVTISVGAAFGDRKDPAGTLYQDADAALYQVKERGGCGCAVYGGEDTPAGSTPPVKKDL